MSSDTECDHKIHQNSRNFAPVSAQIRPKSAKDSTSRRPRAGDIRNGASSERMFSEPLHRRGLVAAVVLNALGVAQDLFPELLPFPKCVRFLLGGWDHFDNLST